MHDPTSLNVRELVLKLPVLGRPAPPAKRQACAAEVLAEADIDCHVRVVGMHVEARIFFGPVTNEEGVVLIKMISGTRKEEPCEWLQQRLLQHRYQVLHANQIHDQAIIVHGVGAWRGQSRASVIVHFVEKHLAKFRSEDGERVHSGHFLPDPVLGVCPLQQLFVATTAIVTIIITVFLKRFYH